MLEITCPHCQLSKLVDPAQLPPDAVRATCPRCKQSFELPRAQADKPPVSEAVNNPQPEVSNATEQQPTVKPVGQAVIEAHPKAGFWMRVVATLLDGLVVFVLQFVLGSLLAVAGFATGNGGSGEIGSLVMLFSYVLGFAYYIFFTGYCGQTPGKMALRIKVIRRDGSDIGYGRAAFREVLCKTISGLLLGIGYLMVAFDEQKQGLHDRMADTYVIKL
ncbi:MAG TPA: RDD family protein [Malonomonas sp.]